MDNIVVGAVATIVILFIAGIIAATSYQVGRVDVAEELKQCLSVAASSDTCDNMILDKYLQKGN